MVTSSMPPRKNNWIEKREVARFKPLDLEDSLKSTDSWGQSSIIWGKEAERVKEGEIRFHGRTICCGEDNVIHGSDMQSRTVSFSISVLQSIPGLGARQLRDPLHQWELRVSYWRSREFQGRPTPQKIKDEKGNCNHNITSTVSFFITMMISCSYRNPQCG